MSAVPNSTFRRCDHPGCGNTYDAFEVLEGRADPTGWIQYPSRSEHFCPEHHDSPVLAAGRRLTARYGNGWQRVLREQEHPWSLDDLRDFLTTTPTSSGLWKRMAREALGRIEASAPANGEGR